MISMISKEEYLKAKSIVDEYEQQEWEEGHRKADWELEDDEFEDEEDENCDGCGRMFCCCDCTCGAYQPGKNGFVKIADCVC
jgi:hypothetical protein